MPQYPFATAGGQIGGQNSGKRRDEANESSLGAHDGSTFMRLAIIG